LVSIGGGKSFFDGNYNAFHDYVDNLIDNSDVEVLADNADKFVLRNFEVTGDELCDAGKPIIRLYTTSWCEVCETSVSVFNNLVKEFVEDGSVKAFHWSIDTGDDLLTQKKGKWRSSK